MRPRQQAQALLDGLKRSYPAYVWIGISDPQGHVLVGTGGQLVGTDIGARPIDPRHVAPWPGPAGTGSGAADSPGGAGARICG